MTGLARLGRALGGALMPPPEMTFSEWAEENIRLAPENSASPGRFHPWKPQRGILDAIGNPLVPRVSVIKAARVGYSTSLIAAIGTVAATDPSPIILLMPTDDDARGVMVDDVDPVFRASPALEGVMRIGRMDGRSTLTQRALTGGGSLKALSAMAPRNLRRHTARWLFCDEVDGMKITKEGDPLKLAEKRTMSYPNRKIVMGSTPTDEETSIIIRRYEESDKRIFEVGCPHCSDPFELDWELLWWKEDAPENVEAICPSCGCGIEERYKTGMVEEGDWRATLPEVTDHAGFRLTILTSNFANAAWGQLVKEYLQAKKIGPDELMVFENTVLGRVSSKAIDHVSQSELVGRREDFGIQWMVEENRWRQDIPEDVAYITAGVDVQPNRLEITLVGHSPNHIFILGHAKILGNATLDTTWDELRALLSTQWTHPLGGKIGIEAAAVDSGDGNMTQHVYDFCEAHQSDRWFAIKGQGGDKPLFRASTRRRRNRTAPLYIVGSDTGKTMIFVNLKREPQEENSFRFSNTLDPEWFDQLLSERRVYKWIKGRLVPSFEPVGRTPHEALDCTVYGIAVRRSFTLKWGERYEALKSGKKPTSLRENLRKLHQ